MEMVNVNVYWNLHKKLWSVRKFGRVVMHAVCFHMENCKFVVWEAGRQRTIRQQAKEIHAFVRGEITGGPLKPPDNSWIRIRYNPYEVSTFVTADGGKPVYSAAAVVMCADGKVFAKEPGYVKV